MCVLCLALYCKIGNTILHWRHCRGLVLVRHWVIHTLWATCVLCLALYCKIGNTVLHWRTVFPILQYNAKHSTHVAQSVWITQCLMRTKPWQRRQWRAVLPILQYNAKHSTHVAQSVWITQCLTRDKPNYWMEAYPFRESYVQMLKPHDSYIT